jgi:hypothetical protein
MKKINNTYITGLFNKLLNESLEDKADDIVNKIENMGGVDAMMREPQIDEEQSEMCEQCETELDEEGMCEQCGTNEELDENLAAVARFVAPIAVNHITSRMNEDDEDYNDDDHNEAACKYHMDNFGPNNERTRKFCKNLKEDKKLTDRRHKSNKNFKKEIGSKFETESVEVGEGNAFSGALAKAKEEGKDTFKVDGKTYNVKESKILKLTEPELVDLIEKIVKEQKNNITTGTAPGMTKYNTVHKQDGKENSEALKEVGKKMSEYVKAGSKGNYETNPKHFPKGNGELAKMSKKGYTMSDAGKEFIDDFISPGMEDLVPDEIQYDENWVGDNIKGSSRTGNNPEWGNAVETDLGEKIAKKQKEKKFRKAKEQAYRKSKQPVTDGTGENSGEGINIKLEGIGNNLQKPLNEEFEKMKKLISYNTKTQ